VKITGFIRCIFWLEIYFHVPEFLYRSFQPQKSEYRPVFRPFFALTILIYSVLLGPTPVRPVRTQFAVRQFGSSSLCLVIRKQFIALRTSWMFLTTSFRPSITRPCICSKYFTALLILNLSQRSRWTLRGTTRISTGFMADVAFNFLF